MGASVSSDPIEVEELPASPESEQSASRGMLKDLPLYDFFTRGLRIRGFICTGIEDTLNEAMRHCDSPDHDQSKLLPSLFYLKCLVIVVLTKILVFLGGYQDIGSVLIPDSRLDGRDMPGKRPVMEIDDGEGPLPKVPKLTFPYSFSPGYGLVNVYGGSKSASGVTSPFGSSSVSPSRSDESSFEFSVHYCICYKQ